MLTRLGKKTRQLRRRFSRSRLLTRWLGYEVKAEESHEPGLILLQIDGLSRRQFEAALAKRRLPFLKKLLRRGYYERMNFYSGLPSTTPAVQGEIMYGVKCAVPAFQFLHRRSGEVFRMFELEAAQTIVKERFAESDPLLKEGASYSNIYSGGAKEARCCAETTNLPNALKNLSPLRMLVIFFLYFFTLVRIVWLAFVELIVGIGDMLRGFVRGREWLSEIKFVPRRVAVSIVLREWIRIVVKLSIDQGKPIIHANLLGYDEQAHRRGPSAAFAHWGLKGIDKVIEDIFKTAKRSDCRDYEVIVFSDHGQEDAKIYDFLAGRSIQDAVKQCLQNLSLPQFSVQRLDYKSRASNFGQEMPRLMKKREGRQDVKKLTPEELAENVILTAMGPLGHIYFPLSATDETKAECAKLLVMQHSVPLVLYRTSDGGICARNHRGLWKLPEDIEVVIGSNHPFLEEVQEDLIYLCQSEDAGDLVISGWDPERPPVTFVGENGAHGSIGSQETQGFALIPRRLPLEKRESRGEPYIRGLDLHHLAGSYIGRPKNQTLPAPRFGATCPATEDSTPVDAQSETRLRVVTYNSHHCVGLDGKCRPKRIAEVLADLHPDLVALQEMDVNRHRSGKQNQAHTIAAELGMHHHFFPVWSGCGEQYGLAVLSRYPMELVREEWLTEACSRSKREARGATWVSVETPQGPVHLLNTHLGLRPGERCRQIEELLSSRWLSDLETREPVIIAGDFNTGPASAVMKKLQSRFQCAQVLASNHRPRGTFPSMLPLRRIDYILVSPHFRVEGITVLRNHFTAVASDHLPLCADLKLPADACPSANANPMTNPRAESEVRVSNFSDET